MENREICLGIQKGCILWRGREGEGCYIGGGGGGGGGGGSMGAKQGDLFGGCILWRGRRRGVIWGGGGMGGEQGDMLGDQEGLHPLEGEGGGATVADGNGMEMCIELIQKR